MDGTLTLPAHNFAAIRKQLGLEPGEPILEAIAKMPTAAAQRATGLLHDIEMELAYKARPQPEAAALLQSLLARGKKLGILTRNGEEITHATLKAAGLSTFFEKDSIIGRDTCAPKPSPDGVLHLLSFWNAARSETVIVGDYRWDIEAGFNAGINTVHYDQSGLFPWPEFARHKISELKQLQTLF